MWLRITPINDTTATTREVLQDLTKTVTQTTTILEAAPTLQSSVPDTVELLVPTRSEGLEDILEREYQVADIAWAYSDVGNINIASLNFPALLIALAPVWDRLKRFAWFRADLRLRFRVNTTPYHYGTVIVATQPASPDTATEWAAHIVQMTGSQSMLLSANNQTPVDMDIPFVLPMEYLPVLSTLTDDIANVKIRVLNPLKIAGAGTNPTISISVFASFKNVKLMGASAIVANSKSTVSPKKETKKKQGFIGKFAGTVGSIAGAMTKVPIIGGIAAAVSPIADAIGSVADWFGWDKPPVLKPTRPTHDVPNHDWTTVRSAIDTTVLGPDQDYRLSTESTVYGVDTPEAQSFKALIQRPMLSDTFAITSAQATSTVFKTLQVKPFHCTSDGLSKVYFDYMSHMCRFFDSWRGGIKYLVFVSTSAYTSARVRVTYQPNDGAVASVPNGGEANSKIVEIQGDTMFSFTVPFVSNAAYKPTSTDIADTSGSTSGIGQLLFSLVSLTRTSGSTDTIYFNIFRAAAEDFEFNTPSDMVVPNCDYHSEFKNTFDSIVPGSSSVIQEGIVKSPPLTHTTDYLKNVPRDSVTVANSATVNIDGLGADYLVYCNPFRFWRGGLHVYTFPTTGFVSFAKTGRRNTYQLHYGCVASKVDAVTLPFDCNLRYRSFVAPTSPDLNRVQLYNHTGASVEYAVSAADDFTLSGIKGPAASSY